MRRRSLRTGVTVLALAVAASALLATAAGAKRPGNGGTGSKGPSCSLVTTSLIQGTLHLTVSAPKATRNGSVLVCSYATTSGGPVIVRFQTGMSKAAFNQAKQAFNQHGEPTSPVPGSSVPAYTSTVGTGNFATNTMVVLDGRTEVLVTAGAPLASVENLVLEILPLL